MKKNAQDLRAIIHQMQTTSSMFYANAVSIGNHPFIEFCGLMNEYIKACEAAAAKGIDFTECNTHTGQHLPLESHQIDYINEKLECIFTGRSVMVDTDLSNAIATEREACAKLCEDQRYMVLEPFKSYSGEELCNTQKSTAKYLATRIRARSRA